MTAHIRKFLFFVFVPVLSMLPAGLLAGNGADSLLRKADSLRLAYDFAGSVGLYDEILDTVTDSVQRIAVEDMKILSENGAEMMDFVSGPTVVARHLFSLDDFYLYYPLPDMSWRPLPNVLDSAKVPHPLVKATYLPEGSSEIFFSAADENGARNIYRTEYRDTIWSLPALLNEGTTSSGDEIYPMLSPDGKQLFFASSGLYGMGGYDLYMSQWDEERNEWGVPMNMGFPYSSPYDDFLFVNTADGKYSIFASTRDCPKDSVCVYVLEYDNMPVRKSMRDASELKSLCRLDPDGDVSKMDNASAVSSGIMENEDTRRYMEKAAEVRALRDSIAACSDNLEKDRLRYAEMTDAEGKNKVAEEILRKEAAIPLLRDSLEKVSAQLQDIEMEFLFSGVVLDPEKLMHEADREVKGASTNYVFTRKNPGKAPEMKIEVPKEKFDYTFMVLPEGRFAEDNTIPDGIVYQIQMFSLSSKATIKQLKGLSPVFEERTASGRYTYRVGVFRKYADVLSNLNKVKKLGFREAFITAFHDGKPVQIQKAKAMEKAAKKIVPLYQIVISPADGVLHDVTVKAIGQMCGKDIAKSEKDGRTEFLVGPFEDTEEMERVVAAIKAAGESDVVTVKTGEKEIDG